MKKIILLFMILLLNITLVGCNKKGNAKLDAKTELYIKQCVINYNRLKNSSYYYMKYIYSFLKNKKTLLDLWRVNLFF